MARFALNPALDVVLLAKRYAVTRRIQIDDLLDRRGADLLAEALAGDVSWRRVLNAGSKPYEIARSHYDALPPNERLAIEAAVNQAASTGFQYRYDTLRVNDAPDERARSATELDRFAEFLCEPATMDFFSQISGEEDIGFADAQATRYMPGDFLTRHDDDVAGKQRRLAYVFGLTVGWKVDWGGLLHFTDRSGRVSDTFVPRFNTLSLFAVPQPHCVSYVAPFAQAPRLSVTGWLRARQPGS